MLIDKDNIFTLDFLTVAKHVLKSDRKENLQFGFFEFVKALNFTGSRKRIKA